METCASADYASRVTASGLLRVLALPLLAMGCYPEFQFGDQDGSGGQGGDPAATATQTSAVTTTQASSSSQSSSAMSSTMMASSSTGPPPPQVSCGPANADMLVQCEPNQECCFHITTASLDNCSSQGCSGNYISFSCDGPQDCMAGQVCCAVFDEDIFGEYFTGPIGCAAQCPSPSVVMCETTADCPSGTCQQIFSSSGYTTEYLGCQ